jgi:DNA polymerase/3'-5' exonuclease PolX
MPNKGMANCLQRLEAVVRASGEPNAGFKANAFRKAANVISTHREKLTSAKEAGKLSGVGKGVMALIQEYLDTGTMGEKEKEGKEEKEKEGKEDKSPSKESESKKAEPVKQSAGAAFL